MESFITNILNTILQVSPIQQEISKFLNTKHLKRVFMRAVEESGHKDILPNNWNTLDISECWNLLSTHRDIKNAIADKLLKDPTLHLQFVALQIDANKKDQNVSPLLDLDERTRINNENDFFRMYPNSSFCVEDLFIEPNYKVYRLINGESKLASINTVNIEDTCKKIMNEQKILLIMGPYGSGKTFISKYLLSKIKDGFPIYIQAHRLPTRINQVFTRPAIDYLINRYKKLYVFLDSCESYFISNQNELGEIQRLTTYYPDLRFVINMRKPTGIELSELLELVYMFLGEISYVTLSYFDKRQVNQWLSLYESRAKELNQCVCVTIDDVNRANKYLKSSCYNPLMMAMMAEPESPYKIEKNSGWYVLFNDFVQKTIKGKFSREKMANKFIQFKLSEYKNFVYDLAIEILRQSNNDIVINENDEDSFVLDPNERIYSAKQDVVDNSIKKNLNIEILNQTRIQYLNCYFFEYEESVSRWRFKDNNILFFLCADKICKDLRGLAKIFCTEETTKFIECFKSFIMNYDGVPLHPVTIDFILDSFTNSNDRDTLIALIKNLIDNNHIINFRKDKSFCLDYNKLKIDILLSVIFIRFNNSYKQKGLGHYFKNISHYYSIVKIVDKDLSSILRRYFRGIKVKNVEFRRINLKGFNWNYSSLNDVNFIQCKFQDTPMNNTSFLETSFLQCYIKKSDLVEYRGNLDFKLCQFNESVFSSEKDSAIFFKNCIIHNIKIVCKKNLQLTLDGCDIRQLSIESKNARICIKGCSVDGKIDLINTKAVFTMPGIIEESQLNDLFHKNNSNSSISVLLEPLDAY